MKYLLSILFLALLLPSVSLAKEGFIFYYDFNDEKDGKPPSEPWKPTAAGKVEVVNFPSSGNKSVEITDPGGGAGMTLIMDSPLKGKTISIEFKWMRKEYTGIGVEILYVMNQKCPDDWSGVCVWWSDQGTIFQYNDAGNWVDGGKIEDEVWHDLKYVMYLDRSKYDFYYDGKQIANNAGFRKSDGIEGIDKINVGNVGDGGSTFIVYFDDIVLYEGDTKPSLSINSKLKLTTKWGEMKSSALQGSHEYDRGKHNGDRFEKGLLPASRLIFVN